MIWSKVVGGLDGLGVVSLNEAKQQCRIMHNHDDEELTRIITASVDLAEIYTKRLLRLNGVKCEIDEYMSTAILPWGNIDVLESVIFDKSINSDGSPSFIVGEYGVDYTFSSISQKITFLRPNFNTVNITYTAGYYDSERPVCVKQAILMMISTFYNNREDVVINMTVENIPLASLKLLDGVKIWHV